MNEVINAAATHRVRRALNAAAETSAQAEEPVANRFNDLLVDMMHFADEQCLDFDAELERARMHHGAEKVGD